MYLLIGVVAALLIVAEEMCLGWIHRMILLAVNFRAFSLRSPRIEVGLEVAKRAVADAYAARDEARRQTSEDGLGYLLAQRRLDAAWKELLHLGGVAFFCGAPADRKLQTKEGRLRVEITLCLTVALFATSAMAVEPVFANSSSATVEFFNPLFGCFLSMPEGAEKQCEIGALRHWQGLSFGEKMNHAWWGTLVWRSVPLMERLKISTIWMLILVSVPGGFGLLFWRSLR